MLLAESFTWPDVVAISAVCATIVACGWLANR